MPLNKALIDAVNNRPPADAPDVQGSDLQAAAESVARSLEIRELAVDGDVAELRRRCREELSPEHFDLASAWAFAVDAEAGDAVTKHGARVAAAVAKHFPAFELAIRALFEHVEEAMEHAYHGDDADWPACCTPPACCRWPAVDGEDSDSAA
jgi:hypothetical protein